MQKGDCKMAIISISTATKQASIFVKDRGDSFSSNIHEGDMVKNLPLVFKDMLDKHYFLRDGIERVIISNGPGYYTSLRIGESFAKGLLVGDDIKKLFKINSLDVLGSMSVKHGRVIAVLKARINLYNCAVFALNVSGAMKRETADMLLTEQELETYRGITGVGEGLNYLEKSWGNADMQISSPDAESMYKHAYGEKIG